MLVVILTDTMRQKFTAFLLYVSLSSNGQTSLLDQAFISIDHIPIVVKNLDSIKKILSEVLYFKIKDGKEHEGIKNCFLKFQDGTYLEFTSPVDSLQLIGKYYSDFLKVRQGGTSLAISVTNAAVITSNLKAKSVSFEADTNKIWKTISPQGINLFFIDYSNKTWKDTKINTTHPNQALLLKSTYIISNNLEADINKYKSFGFKQIKKGKYSGIPYKQIVVGQSNLYFLDSARANKLTGKFRIQNLNGICGFEIKVSSLATINKLLPKTDNIVITNTKTTYFLKDYNLFIDFSE
jgi:Glyoxalase-like domain